MLQKNSIPPAREELLCTHQRWPQLPAATAPVAEAVAAPL